VTWVIHLIGSNKLFLFNYMIKKTMTLNGPNFYKKIIIMTKLTKKKNSNPSQPKLAYQARDSIFEIRTTP